MAKERKSLWGKCPDNVSRFQRTAEGIVVNGKLVKWVDFMMPGYIVELAKEVTSWTHSIGPCEMMFLMDAFAKHPRESRDEAFEIIYQSFAKPRRGSTAVPDLSPGDLKELLQSGKAQVFKVPTAALQGLQGLIPPGLAAIIDRPEDVAESIVKAADGIISDPEEYKKVMDRHPGLDISRLGFYITDRMVPGEAEKLESACRSDPELLVMVEKLMDVSIESYASLTGDNAEDLKARATKKFQKIKQLQPKDAE